MYYSPLRLWYFALERSNASERHEGEQAWEEVVMAFDKSNLMRIKHSGPWNILHTRPLFQKYQNLFRSDKEDYYIKKYRKLSLMYIS